MCCITLSDVNRFAKHVPGWAGVIYMWILMVGYESTGDPYPWNQVREEWDKMAQPLPFALMWNDGCLEESCVQLKNVQSS